MQTLSKLRPAASAHRSPIQKLYYCEPLDRLVACCQDGTFGFWNAADMSHHRTFQQKGLWANDCVYLPVKRLLACASYNETVSSFLHMVLQGCAQQRRMAGTCDRAAGSLLAFKFKFALMGLELQGLQNWENVLHSHIHHIFCMYTWFLLDNQQPSSKVISCLCYLPSIPTHSYPLACH